MCPAVVVTTSIGLNCVVTFILECPVYVHLKPPSLPTKAHVAFGKVS